MGDPQNQISTSASSSNSTCLMKSMKAVYPADQQVKFLHLQAEVESLLQQLQSLKQQRQASTPLDETTEEIDQNQQLKQTEVCC
jgi:hypothetical protein